MDDNDINDMELIIIDDSEIMDNLNFGSINDMPDLIKDFIK